MRNPRNHSIRRTGKGIVLVLLCSIFWTACGTKAFDFSAYPIADMSGYAGLDGYEKDLMFSEVTVIEIEKLIDEKETFAFFASFSTCPWCNALIPYLNDAALESGVRLGYLDTRKKNDWTSNTEIDDYDRFVALFGSYLEEDEDGEPHLYVPHFFVIKKGEVVYEHQGLIPSIEEPDDALSEEQKQELVQVCLDGLALIR